jgi:hypothetical protein
MEKLLSMFVTVLITSLAAVSAPSFAVGTAVDVSGIVTSIGDQAAPVALIGGAVLLLVVGIKAFHWVRRALS